MGTAAKNSTGLSGTKAKSPEGEDLSYCTEESTADFAAARLLNTDFQKHGYISIRQLETKNAATQNRPS